MRGVTRMHLLLVGLHDISTRTPHAGSDFERVRLQRFRRISTRTPHAGSDGSSDDVLRGVDISTRTPHAGSDSTEQHNLRRCIYFNPHSPCGE